VKRNTLWKTVPVVAASVVAASAAFWLTELSVTVVPSGTASVVQPIAQGRAESAETQMRAAQPGTDYSTIFASGPLKGEDSFDRDPGESTEPLAGYCISGVEELALNLCCPSKCYIKNGGCTNNYGCGSPFGASNCCKNTIYDNNKQCSGTRGAPCVINKFPE
jgi:hypothetical protein